MRAFAVALVAVAACGDSMPIRLDEAWPTAPHAYEVVTDAWTRDATLRGQYQETLDLRATFKGPDWRAAHAERTADNRGLSGAARDQVLEQAKADMSGPYEFELMLTTWDRRENDLDRGKNSVWHVVLVDDQGHEIAPLEIKRDRRPLYTVRAEFPAMGDFATAYVAQFPRTIQMLGPNVHSLRLRLSGERGGVELVWAAPAQ
jgi:hypothetical protein